MPLEHPKFNAPVSDPQMAAQIAQDLINRKNPFIIDPPVFQGLTIGELDAMAAGLIDWAKEQSANFAALPDQEDARLRAIRAQEMAPSITTDPADSVERNAASLLLSEHFRQLVEIIMEVVPRGRRRGQSLVRLEESLMWANRAILNEVDTPGEP